MNILALIGSYRKQGNTARVVQLIGARLESLAAQHGRALNWEMLYLGDMDIRPCRGCRVCFDRGEDKCPLKDDVPAIKAKMDAADVLILASPVYVDDVSGLVKTWMDRLAYLCHRPGLGGKCAWTLATVGGSPTSHTLRTMNAALLTWGYHLVGQAGFKLGALAPVDEIERRRPQIEQVADRLFDAVSRRRALYPSFISLLTFKVQRLAWQRDDPTTYDYLYWKNQGWLEPGCTFYAPHRAGRIKVMLARLVGAAVARVMLG